MKEFKQRLLTLYKQEWATKLRTNDRFTFYSRFKSILSLSSYLNGLKQVKVRNFLIRIRLDVSKLKTHELRFTTNRSQADFACPFCRNATENEMHFIFTCLRYTEIRKLYKPKKYYRCPSGFRLTLLLAASNKSILFLLATYIFKAFQITNRSSCSSTHII